MLDVLYLLFCGIPVRVAQYVFGLLCGLPGYGKTAMLKKQIRSCGENRESCVIADAGDGIAEWLRALGLPGMEVLEIDPVHVGGVGIDFPAITRRNSDRLRLARFLIPPVKGENAYFNDRAALYVYDALRILAYWARDGWELADLVRLCLNPRLMRIMGRRTPGVGSPLADCKDGKTRGNILSTMKSYMTYYAIVAALLLKCERKLDLSDPHGVMIVVSWSDRHSTALSGLFGFIFSTLIIFALSGRRTERLHLYLDEMRSYPSALAEAVGAAVRRGRKALLTITATLHSAHGLRGAWGKEVADEILELASHYGILHCGYSFAKDLADVLGKPEVLQQVAPHPSNKGGVTRHVIERHNVTADEISNLPLPVTEPGKDEVVGIYRTPEEVAEFSSPFLKDTSFPPGYRRKAKVEHPPEAEELADFDLRDMVRVGFGTSQEVQDAINLSPPRPRRRRP